MYGFYGVAKNSAIIRMLGYKRRSNMRVAVKQYLIKAGLLGQLVRWYEYKVDLKGFRKVKESMK